MAIKENNKGLSFVELLVSVLVSTIVVSALLYLLV
jgi:Tfp pilus assembly protein PilW